MTSEREVRAWSLQAFPVVIDPATAIIEFQGDIRDMPGGLVRPEQMTWRQLHRVTPTADVFPFPILNFAPNLYGLSQNVHECQFLLGYTSHGVLFTLLTIDDGDWVLSEFAEEVTGQRNSMTSVRIFFPEGGESTEFLAALERMRKDGMMSIEPQSADVETIIRTLMSNNVPPRLVNVAAPVA